MRAAVGTVLAVIFGGGLSLFAGAASAAAPARAATPATPHALPRAALATTVPATADCTIYSGTPTSASPCGAPSDDTVGADGNGALYRTMVSFSGGLGLPAGSTVLSATLTIHALGAFGSTATWVFGMTRSFAAGAATWNTYDGVNPWSTAGGDYDDTLQASSTVSGAGTVSFSITPLVQSWVDGADTIPQLMILGFSPQGNAFSFASRASGNGPVLTIAYQPLATPTTTTSPPPTGPVATTPVSTPLPVSHAARALRIKVLLSWTWNRAVIHLRGVKVGAMPGDTKVSLGCQGAGCPRRSRMSASGARTVRRMLLRLAGRRYRAGDVLTVRLTAAGYRQERAGIFFRNGRKPLILG
jgi:hypothetical protein